MRCIEPFKCLNVDNNGISSCCVMPAWAADKIDFNNDPTLTAVRKNWLNGTWPKECNNCKKVELAGQESRRQSVEQWAVDNTVTDTTVELIRLDYWLGNTCNLRCPTCGPDYSIAWQNDLGIKATVVKNERWRELNLDKLKWVHFNGGEPLLIDHMEFLNAIPNKGEVNLNYNTNGTIRPNDSLIKLWEQFKLVQLDFSIDGLDKRFEYIRYPAKWSVVRDNLFWFRDTMPVNFMFDINATVSVLNVLTINETENWFKENFNTNRLGDPISFRKQDAIGNLGVDTEPSDVLSYLNSLDNRRNTNWKQTFPELIDLLACSSVVEQSPDKG